MDFQTDLKLKETIESWGLPECLEKCKEEIVYKFDSEDLPKDEFMKYHCAPGSCKFCLYDLKTKKKLLTMEFFQFKQRDFRPEKIMKLDTLIVHDHMLRNKGIASYYMSKFIEYCKTIGINSISINACPTSSIFRGESKHNVLSKENLVAFYESFNSPDMPIEVREC
jgi:hypothetical protein